MIIDTSALIAVLVGEDGLEGSRDALQTETASRTA